MATIIKVSSTRKASEDAVNLTFGKGRMNGLTVTGTIYNASGYIQQVEDEDGLIDEVDLSSQLYKVEATITFGKNVEEEVKTKLAKFFADAAEEGFFTINAGLIIECRSITAPVEGEHPVTREKTEKVLVTSTKLIGIEVAPDLNNENIVERTISARNNAKERKESGLAAYLKKKAEGFQEVMSNFLPKEEEKKKEGKDKLKEKVAKGQAK